MTRRVFAASFVIAAFASVPRAFGQESKASEAITCPRAAHAPTIDGAFDDPSWATAALADKFTKPGSADTPPKSMGVKLCFDDQALYLAFTCQEPAPEKIKAKARDGSPDVWEDDCVEVWIRTGDNQLGHDQFIVNAGGARQCLRMRLETGEKGREPDWPAKARIGKDSWTVEMAIPFSFLGVPAPSPGTLFQIKFGREDYAGGGQDLSTWPPGSAYGIRDGFGRIYFETDNLLRNPDMSQRRESAVADWGFGKEDRGLFSSVEDQGKQVIRFETPNRYSVAQQDLRLKPNGTYRLEAKVRGAAGVYLRARTSARKGDPSTPYSVNSKPGDDYQEVGVSFPTGETGEALIIIGNHEGLGRGEVLIADLRVFQDVGFDAEGLAIPFSPGQVTAVTKAPVADCRALRGFVAAPVDGRLNSYNWNMDVWEYNMPGAGAGVGYRYRNNDGLHITLADDEGVDAVQIRKGARVRLYRDAERYDAPGAAPLLWQFQGKGRTCRALFPERVKSRRFSFFDLQDGLIGDVSFLRISTPAERPASTHPALNATGPAEPGLIAGFLHKRFSNRDPVYRLGAGNPVPLKAESGQAIHLLSEPLQQELSLRSISLQLRLPSVPSECPLTVAVQDPLNPRQELMGADFSIAKPGEFELVMDFPDQVIPAGKVLWLSLRFGAAVTIEQARIELHDAPREQAIPQAVAFRKLVMKGLFCELSEARQWNTFRKNMDLDKFYKENRWGEGVRELAETIAQCKALGPDDDTVRCYDEWFWRNARDLPKFEPKIADIPAAPPWAVLVRQAWHTAREVPKWWLDNRLVPTGELGGLVGDDSDMYQNFADFPMLENDGAGAEIKQAAANLAELAEAENLEQGLNKRTMDPLHAYEEGVNHAALMLWWNYGDPVYFERALAAAKAMPALTVVTEKGHRHFKSQECGAEDLRINRELGVDGGYQPLMMHPCLEVAWYNGSPKVIQFLREWGDAWIEHQRPDDYATSVDVKTEKATETSKQPLRGGGQPAAHCFLYWLTDDQKYIRPFMDFFQKGQDTWPARKFVPELWHRGALDSLAQTEREAVLRGNRITQGIALGNKQAICDALKEDIAELQRFKTMYTDAEVFTDRVFLYAISNATRCYTGGFATRNDFHHTHAASWEGFGTNYAALVLRARRDHFKTLIYNFRDEPMKGTIRLWTLDHGRYRLTLGPDQDGDDKADSLVREETLEVSRVTAIPLSLPAKTVMVFELQQVEKLDDLLSRPDLAISSREIKVEKGVLTGQVHNIGGKDAPEFTLALLDAQGKVQSRQTLGPLPAPLDLDPKRVPFRFENVGESLRGWRVVVDADNQIAELFEGNNSVGL